MKKSRKKYGVNATLKETRIKKIITIETTNEETIKKNKQSGK